MLRLIAVLLTLNATAGCLSKPDREGAATDGGVDARPDTCVVAACEGAGGRCMGGVCTIEGRPNADINCPNGMPCQVTCMMRDTCRSIRCHDATSCSIDCIGENSCDVISCDTADSCGVACEGTGSCSGAAEYESVYCVAAPCTVTCEGDDSCRRGIVRTSVAGCLVSCCGEDSCGGGTTTCTVDNSSCE